MGIKKEENPSEVTDVYWIYADNEKSEYLDSTEEIECLESLKKSGKCLDIGETDDIDEFWDRVCKSGKWLIFANIGEVDEVWAKIKKATEEGKLGGNAKVATAKPNPNATNQSARVICVYTYDWADEKDVKKVRQQLRKLGITRKISYKTDADTLNGKYSVRGDKGISKYYE